MVRFLSLLLVGVAVVSCSRATGTGPATLPDGAIGASATRSSQASELVTYTPVYSFSPPPDGNSPSSDVIFTNNRFYGTTYGGGATPSPGPCAQGCGTVYSIDPSGSKPEKIVYAFKGGEGGAIPQGGLTNPVNGVIYGTTSNGGHKDAG